MKIEEVISPLPGTFYRRPAPDKPPYKEVGDKVAKGETLGLVEVMKSFYELKSEFDGTVKEFLVENEAPLTAGQVVARVET